MNKKIMTWSTYEAPKVQTLDVLSEGVLCASTGGTFSINKWEEEDEALEF